jgi:hypothetical protein
LDIATLLDLEIKRGGTFYEAGRRAGGRKRRGTAGTERRPANKKEQVFQNQRACAIREVASASGGREG